MCHNHPVVTKLSFPLEVIRQVEQEKEQRKYSCKSLETKEKMTIEVYSEALIRALFPQSIQ